MKTFKIILPALFSGLMFGCKNHNSTNSDAVDTTSTNPTSNSSDYHPDERQHIPITDSSNIIGTDSVGASESTPNTGTVKTYNTKKGTKDTTKH